MYRVEKGSHGYTLTFSGSISTAEIKKWKEESFKLLGSASRDFGVFVDVRNLISLPEDVFADVEEVQREYRKNGMSKSVVIYSNPDVTELFKKLAKKSGIGTSEKYVNASNEPHWKQKGLDWLIKGINPEV